MSSEIEDWSAEDWARFYRFMRVLTENRQLVVMLQHQNGQDTLPVTADEFRQLDGVKCTIVVHTNANAYDFWRGIYGGEQATARAEAARKAELERTLRGLRDE